MVKKKLDSSSFGYRHLCKEGWSEGDGLGKNRSGDADPIKVNLKKGTAGLGHDVGKEFTDHWWDHVFNKAAAKVSVVADGDEVKVKSDKLSEDKKAKLKHKVLYGNFVQGTTLTQGKEVHHNSSTDEDEDTATKPSISALTDEELLKACGGRTAHKGGRHGATMSGKLRRLEQQEQTTPTVSDDDECRKMKKKKKNRHRENVDEIEEEKPKKKKKKHKETDVKINSSDDSGHAELEADEKVKKKKKKKDKR